MDERAKKLLEQGNYLFGKKADLDRLWQDVALNFYPERADFTVTRSIGDAFAANLMSSYPVLARRDLGNSFSSMLRRDNWFNITVEDDVDNESLRWLQWATSVQRRAMYDRVARFVRATKEGDHDFAAFGQCCITPELNKDRSALLFRSWHLRDLAWCENAEGVIDTVHRKWKPTVRTLAEVFGEQKLSPKLADRLRKEPYTEVECRHIVVPSEDYNDETVTRGISMPFVSIYIEVESGTILEERPRRRLGYTIPRWQTVSGSQYAYSPATVAALPDARLIQAMTLVLLDAGEKAASPPLIAVGDAIRSDIDIRAGGVTWVDSEYDERLGEVLRPITTDARGLPIGLDMQAGVQRMIAEAFYLTKLTLPVQAGDMTATEVSQRVQEYIRQALPLFEPMEQEYNGQLCEDTFSLLFDNGAFGAVQDIPRDLSNRDVQFKFESPLRAAVEREKGARFGEALQLIEAAAPVDPSVAANLDAHKALRDALNGIGVPAKWIRDEQDAEDYAKEIKANQKIAQAAEVAKSMPTGAMSEG